MNYTWNFSIIWDYREVFVQGAAVTAKLAIYSIAIGLSLGLIFGMARASSVVLLRYPAAVFIELFRSTPTLVQLVWIYYALPILTGVQLTAMAATITGLGLHTAAYMAEIFRGGINSIEKGQRDAAYETNYSPAGDTTHDSTFHERVREPYEVDDPCICVSGI
jgi:polar amino acid transport system permease protein